MYTAMFLDDYVYQIPRSKQHVRIERYRGGKFIIDSDAAKLLTTSVKALGAAFDELLTKRALTLQDRKFDSKVTFRFEQMFESRVYYSSTALIAMGYRLNPRRTRAFSDWLSDKDIESLTKGRRDLGNFFTEHDGSPRMHHSYVGFVDILGARDSMQSTAQNGLRTFRDALQESSKHLEDPEAERIKTQVRYFSDCVSLITPANFEGDRYAESSWSDFASQIQRWQLTMAIQGFFVRGGIAFGLMYTDTNTIYGEPHIKAYVLESEKAVHPKILLDESALSIIVAQQGYYAERQPTPHQHDIVVENYNQAFLNYLSSISDDSNADELLSAHKSAIEIHLEKPYGSRVLDKYKWSAHYHNWFCDTWSTSGVDFSMHKITTDEQGPVFSMLPKLNWSGKQSGSI